MRRLHARKMEVRGERERVKVRWVGKGEVVVVVVLVFVEESVRVESM